MFEENDSTTYTCLIRLNFVTQKNFSCKILFIKYSKFVSYSIYNVMKIHDTVDYTYWKHAMYYSILDLFVNILQC